MMKTKTLYRPVGEKEKHLHGKYKNKFKRVVFTILTKKEEVIKPFEEI